MPEVLKIWAAKILTMPWTVVISYFKPLLHIPSIRKLMFFMFSYTQSSRIESEQTKKIIKYAAKWQNHISHLCHICNEPGISHVATGNLVHRFIRMPLPLLSHGKLILLTMSIQILCLFESISYKSRTIVEQIHHLGPHCGCFGKYITFSEPKKKLQMFNVFSMLTRINDNISHTN